MSVGDTNDKTKGERKMFIYVDWENQEVKTTKGIRKEIDEILDDVSLNDDYMSFYDYLGKYYFPCEIFNLSDKEKETVLIEYERELRSLIEDSVFNRYEEIEVEDDV
jgi:hypothetical protein